MKGYAFFDTETTGLGQADIVDYGIILTDNSLRIKSYTNFYVKNDLPMQAGATAVNGITDDFLRLNATKTIRDVYNNISQLNEDYILVAHNSDFDFRQLKENFNRRLGLSFTPKEFIDTGERYTELLGLPFFGKKEGIKFKMPKLTELTKYALNIAGKDMSYLDTKFEACFKQKGLLHTALYDSFQVYYDFLILN